MLRRRASLKSKIKEEWVLLRFLGFIQEAVLTPSRKMWMVCCCVPRLCTDSRSAEHSGLRGTSTQVRLALAAHSSELNVRNGPPPGSQGFTNRLERKLVFFFHKKELIEHDGLWWTCTNLSHLQPAKLNSFKSLGYTHIHNTYRWSKDLGHIWVFKYQEEIVIRYFCQVYLEYSLLISLLKMKIAWRKKKKGHSVKNA